MVKHTLNRTKGFTLIELMLSSALLMTIMFAGYYAYSLYSQKWQKRVDVYWHSTKQGIGVDALNKLFISTSNYVVKNENGRESIYFEATEDKIRFVSNSPIMSVGSALVELSVSESNETKQLVYREKNLQGFPLFLQEDIENFIEWEQQIVLLEGFSEINWSFYGWTSFQDALKQAEIAELGSNEELRKAYNTHALDEIRVLPERVNLRLINNAKSSQFSIEMPNHSVFSVIANARSGA